MTTALIRKTRKGSYRSIQCTGHADYAKPDEKDIVCAAISVLMINTINSIEKFTSDGKNLVVDTNQLDGFLQCTFSKELSKEAHLLMQSLELGLEAIEKEYGNKYFELKFEEV